jgi:hypothetical protein
MTNITNEAIDAVGKAAPGDRQLGPDLQDATLPAEAGALARVLRQPRLQTIFTDFLRFSAKADSSQKSYKRKAKAAAIAGFFGIVVGGLIVLPGRELAPPGMIQAAVAVQAVLVVLSLMLSILIGFTKPFDVWMEARAEAENARHDLFNDIMLAEEAPGEREPDELPLLLLQLEYFRRYQLDVQRNYYRGRGNEHLAASRAARNWRIAALFILFISMFPIVWVLRGKQWVPALVASLFAGLPDETHLAEQVFIGTGLVASGLQGLLASLALISLNDRNAARYLSTAANLDDLAGRPLAEARERAAAGDRRGVLAFAALVQQEISSEHREWIALRKFAPDLSLNRLATLRLPKLR